MTDRTEPLLPRACAVGATTTVGRGPRHNATDSGDEPVTVHGVGR